MQVQVGGFGKLASLSTGGLSIAPPSTATLASARASAPASRPFEYAHTHTQATLHQVRTLVWKNKKVKSSVRARKTPLLHLLAISIAFDKIGRRVRKTPHLHLLAISQFHLLYMSV